MQMDVEAICPSSVARNRVGSVMRTQHDKGTEKIPREFEKNGRREGSAGYESEETSFFLNSVPSILIGLDMKGRIRRWNTAAANIFGLQREEVLGMPLDSCGIDWRGGDIGAKLDRIRDLKGQIRWDDLVFEKEGSSRQLGFTIAYITPPHAATGELLIVGADVTARREAEAELRSNSAFLEAQTNATLDGILVVDENSNTILLNKRFNEIFKVPPQISEQKRDRELLDHVLPQIKNPEAFLQRVRDLYTHPDETSRDELELTNGTVLDRYSSPVVGRDGTHYGRMWIFRDITDRKNNEVALRQLSQAVEQSPVSVVITDLSGNIAYVNRRFTETSGYSSAEVVGQNPRVLKSGHTSSGDYKQLWETITQGHEWRGEFYNRKKNGELYWETVAISPIKDENGNPTHFLGVKEDITERKIMEGHLRQAQKLEAIGQLAAGIAHEINTPVQFVGDNTQFVKEAWESLEPALSLLRSSPHSSASVPSFPTHLVSAIAQVNLEYLLKEVPSALEQSLEGLGRVARIVHAMKEFSHPGSEEKKLTDINKAISTTLTVARNEWKYVAEVETVLAADLQPVPCNAGEFNQVVLNLIINSAHAIAEALGDKADKKGKITIRTKQDAEWTTISIQDTGSGIPPEIQSRIFEPFFTTKEVGKGTGQGLSIAHNTIVQRHSGRLWFQSEVGKGTTFFIQLPMTTKGMSQ
jgi:PAS domain S-box-containing protein